MFGEVIVEVHVAVRVGGDIGRAEIGLTFAMVGRITGAVREEIERVGSISRTVQAPCDRAVGAQEDREVLQIVRAGIAVAGIIGGDAVRAQIDAQRAVMVDVVAAQGVARAAQHADARRRAVANGQRSDRAVAAVDDEAVRAGSRSRAVDGERASGLGRTVDDHRVGNDGQRAAQVDREGASAW